LSRIRDERVESATRLVLDRSKKTANPNADVPSPTKPTALYTNTDPEDPVYHDNDD
jgi:hypothetical protein